VAILGLPHSLISGAGVNVILPSTRRDAMNAIRARERLSTPCYPERKKRIYIFSRARVSHISHGSLFVLKWGGIELSETRAARFGE
jgi:hypothetical protein